jgi:hypothetical protein
MQERKTEKIILGTAFAFAAGTLLPIVKNTLKPLVASGAEGTAGVTGGIRYALRVARDEIEDIVAEAQFERMRKRLDREIAAESAFAMKKGDVPHVKPDH